MTAPRDGSGLGVRGWQETAATEDHTALLAWYAEQDALRAPIPRCECFYLGEFVPGCVLHAKEAS